jgi:aldehyde dehydrogenase (NAD+)
LKKLKKAVEVNEEEIIQSLKKDLRKPPFESYATEIGLVLTEIELFLKKLNSWTRPEKVKTSLMHFWSTSYIYKEPYGTVLVLSPWNYPFLLSLLPVVGAVAAGNTVVLKPSEYAPATSALLSKIINNTFSEGLITVIEGDKKISKSLLQEGFDYMFFTGSRQVGKEIMKAAAENLTPVTLELGGKSPCIVDRDANIDLTARRIVWGKFLNAGQTCIAPDYLLLHKDIKEKLLVKATEYIRIFYGEKPELSPDYGRIVNERHFERLTGLLNRGKIITVLSSLWRDRRKWNGVLSWKDQF